MYGTKKSNGPVKQPLDAKYVDTVKNIVFQTANITSGEEQKKFGVTA